MEAETGSMTEARTNKIPSHEWVPITPSTPHSQQRPRPRPIRFENVSNGSTTTKPDKSPLNATWAEAAVANHTTDALTPMPMPASTEETAAKEAQAPAGKQSRRERILNLARQNARTPLPKLPEKPPPPPEAEMIDEESERQGKERTIRERLWRLVGSNY